MITLYIAIAALALGVATYSMSATVRRWCKAIWNRWFRDSEVNAIADLLTAVGTFATLADDPSFVELLKSAGVSPTALIVGGVVLRFIRALRAPDMIPLTKPPEQT